MPKVLDEWLGYCNKIEFVPKTGQKKVHNKWWAGCVIEDDDGSYRVHAVYAALGQKGSEHIERYDKQGKSFTLGQARMHFASLLSDKQSPRKGYEETPFDVPFGTPTQVTVPSFTRVFAPATSPAPMVRSSVPPVAINKTPTPHVHTVISCVNCGTLNDLYQDDFCRTCGMQIAVSTTLTSSGGITVLATNGPSVVTPPLTGPLAPGHQLGQNRYTIVGKIGQGGMGAVYKAKDHGFAERLVAMKELVPDDTLTAQELQEAQEGFKQEALLLAPLSHQSLPRIYDSFTEQGRSYLVMDFIEGETLETLMEKAVPARLPVRQIIEMAITLCDVLDYLHTRQPPIIFRDLKPANIMLTTRGHVYLIDFGIARLFKFGQKKDTTALGSPGYAAPEQYGKGQSVPQTDLYGLGATLHHALTGDDPSEAPFTFAPFPPGIEGGAALEKLVLGMVELQVKKRRPVNAVKVRHELLRIASTLKTHHP